MLENGEHAPVIAPNNHSDCLDCRQEQEPIRSVILLINVLAIKFARKP
jgi:hypothetical protein